MTADRAGFAGVSWAALGSTVNLLVTEEAALVDAKILLARELDQLDVACSRFRSDSELSKANRAGGRAVRIGPVFEGALRAALEAARATGGDVDPTVGGPLIEAGYDQDFSALPADRPAPTARLRVVRTPAWSQVELDDHGVLRLPAGVELDLGATAKAWCADRAAFGIYEQLGCGVLVGLGGDIAIRGPAPEGGWSVRVQEQPGPVAVVPSGPSCVVSIQPAPSGSADAGTGGGYGLATSSTTARRWRRGGRLMHHIIDPRTGMPAVGQWRTVSVAAPTCLEANVQTTAAIVRSAAAVDRLRASGLPGWLVAGDGSVTTVNGWPLEVAA